MIHIVRLWVGGQSHFLVGDDDERIRQQKNDFIRQGAIVMKHDTIDEPTCGLVEVYRKGGEKQ